MMKNLLLGGLGKGIIFEVAKHNNITVENFSASNCGFFISRILYKKEAQPSQQWGNIPR